MQTQPGFSYNHDRHPPAAFSMNWHGFAFNIPPNRWTRGFCFGVDWQTETILSASLIVYTFEPHFLYGRFFRLIPNNKPGFAKHTWAIRHGEAARHD